MLTLAGSVGRQERFRAMLGAQGLDAAVIADPSDIYYLTGLLLERFPALLYLERDGGAWLACHTTEGEALVDGRAIYEPHLLFTSNPDPVRRLGAAMAGLIDGRRRGGRIGWQQESLPRFLGETIESTVAPAAWAPIDDPFRLLQSRKDADEIELLRKAAACSLAAYAADRATIRPGVNELEVVEAGHRAANLQAGEVIFHGGDYQSGQLGGFARNRAIQAGELYIVDAWSIYRGYWSDLCRTFSVAEPVALQREVFDLIAAILTEVPDRLKPGMRGTELWHWIDGRLREHPHLRGTGLTHHAGHSVGLRAHEMPDLNRDREGVLEAGNVVSVEPGAYSPELRGGVRLENTFLITETGCETLSEYPLALE